MHDHDYLMDLFEQEVGRVLSQPKPVKATHDKWTDDDGVDWWVHRWNQGCVDYGCAVHAPTDHHMSEWPQVMSMGTLVVRVCQHDVEHPDPDSLYYFKRRGEDHMGVHNCDGCCNENAGLNMDRLTSRGGETRSVPAVNYPPGYTHAAHDCEICSPYGLDMNDIPNGS